jgi:Family of unknown function (DUF5946)
MFGVWAACRRWNCGLPGPLREELVARDFTDVMYGRLHRMAVDIYCLQHPDRYCASAKSLAAHLMGLCWFMTHTGTRAIGPEALRAWLDGTPRLEKPKLPSFRGKLTIADVRAAADRKNFSDDSGARRKPGSPSCRPTRR